MSHRVNLRQSKYVASLWAVELRDVSARRQGDANFLVVCRILVVLGDPLSDLGSRHPDDGIGSRIVVGFFAENLYPQRAFLDVVRVPRQGLFHYEAQEVW